MAYFNLDRFIAEFQDGFQRPNQFRCLLDVNTVANGRLAAQFPRAAQLLAQGLLCEGTRTPSRSFDTVSKDMAGYQEKYPVFTTYTDLECSFFAPLLTDGNGSTNQVLGLFNEWQNNIQRRVDNTTFYDDAMVLQFPDAYRLRKGMSLQLLNAYNSKRSDGLFGINVKVGTTYIPPIEILNRVFGKHGPPDDTYTSPPTITYNFFNVYPITVESAPVAWQSSGEIQRITVSFAYSYWTN